MPSLFIPGHLDTFHLSPACAVFIAPFCLFGLPLQIIPCNTYLQWLSLTFRCHLTMQSQSCTESHRNLFAKLDSLAFNRLFDTSSPLNISFTLPLAWITALTSVEPNLCFDPSEFRMAIMWWLGLYRCCNGLLLSTLP